MVSAEKTYSKTRDLVRKVGKAGLVVVGFFLIFFTTISRLPRAPQALGGDGGGIAHADAPSSGDSSGGGDSSSGGGCDGSGCAGDSGCG